MRKVLEFILLKKKKERKKAKQKTQDQQAVPQPSTLSYPNKTGQAEGKLGPQGGLLPSFPQEGLTCVPQTCGPGVHCGSEDSIPVSRLQGPGGVRRGGEGPCLDPVRNAGHGHPLFVLLGLCRISGIVLREALARTCSAALGEPSLQAGRFH